MSDSSRNPISPAFSAGSTPGADSAPAVAGVDGIPVRESAIVDALRTVFDPEIPVNIYDIGLIYGIEIRPDGAVAIKMTLTAPGCPAAQELPQAVKESVANVPGVASSEVEVVWDPVWNPSMMSEAARLQLGFF